MAARSIVLAFLGTRVAYDSLSHILWFRAIDKGVGLARCGVTRDALMKLAGKSVREAAASSVYEAHLLRIRATAQRKTRNADLNWMEPS